MSHVLRGTCAAVAGAAIVWLGAAVAGEPRTSERLVWHVDAPSGKGGSREADAPINPASVVKLATTLWALESLGPDYRFQTSISYRGALDASAGTLDGDLIVLGGDDPDFHVENAWLVAQALNETGLFAVTGKLLVDDRFSIGWEGGSEGREANAERRANEMGARLRDALDPARHDRQTRRSIEAFKVRRGLEVVDSPRIEVRGGIGRFDAAETDAVPVIHLSNPLHRMLKRFNAWSNNDIERLGAVLGPPDQMTEFVRERLGRTAGKLRFATLSGLGSNRMTPRTVTSLLRELQRSARSRGLDLFDLLPVAGCDPGTLEHYPELRSRLVGRLAAKTGTLTRTDGGIAVLAGLVRTGAEDLVFCVAAPDVGTRQRTARREIEQWLLRQVDDSTIAPAASRPTCNEPPVFSDTEARAVAECSVRPRSPRVAPKARSTQAEP